MQVNSAVPSASSIPITHAQDQHSTPTCFPTSLHPYLIWISRKLKLPASLFQPSASSSPDSLKFSINVHLLNCMHEMLPNNSPVAEVQ